MDDAPTAAIIIVGAEILSGATLDTNSRFLARELFDLGVELRQITIIPDKISRIAREVRSTYTQHTYVITSGGVGPTPDDVTMEGIATALDRRLYRHPEIEQTILSKYKDDPANEYRLAMADVPEGARLVNGPGFFIPVVVVENIYVFPGIPEILEMKFKAMRDMFKARPFLTKKLFVDCYESTLVPHLQEMERLFPQVRLGSYPTMKERNYRVLLSLQCKDSKALERAFKHLMDRLPSGEIVEA